MSVATLQTKWRHADSEYKAARRRYFKAVDSRTATPAEVAKAKKEYERAEEKAAWAVKELNAALDYEDRHRRYNASQNRRR